MNNEINPLRDAKQNISLKTKIEQAPKGCMLDFFTRGY